jgi:hypothetical protein
VVKADVCVELVNVRVLVEVEVEGEVEVEVAVEVAPVPNGAVLRIGGGCTCARD